MRNPENFLFPFFDELRREGLPLGVEEYLEAVACLRAGIGLEAPRRLAQTLCLIWAKSREDREVLQRLFRKRIAPLLQHETPRGKAEKEEGAPEIGEARDVSLEVSFGQAVMKPGEPDESDFQRAERPYELDRETGQFQLTPRFPVRRRETTRAFRGLRRMGRIGPPVELDIDETVETIGKTGFFLGPVLRPLRKNMSALLLLMDRHGSMDPFLPMTENLEESILKGGMLGCVEILYFHNCPTRLLYEQPNLTGPVPLENILKEEDRACGPCTLIVGDAGAARGYFDREREEATEKFLRRVGDCTNNYAWINPVPPSRWPGSTAEKVAKMAPMFPWTEDGLKDAIDRIGGRTV